MKINQIIREKRKELGLTQEQVAEYLGVSTPAVNKWEKGTTYPDITILPALARLLKTDLNTLMSFQEDLTELEIENFVNELDCMIQKEGYPAAFDKAIEKIQEYPSCDSLLYSVAVYLEGALFLYHVSEPEPYRERLERFYQRLALSDDPGIRDTAIQMLISYARNGGDFSKAEELIETLPASSIDQQEQFAILYQHQKKYKEAEEIWERRIWKGVTAIQTALINMLEIALAEHRCDDAEFLADMYESVTYQFCFPEWMRYNAHLQLAIEKQDKEECVLILQRMLPAMKQKWTPRDNRLYRNTMKGDSTFLSSRLADTLCVEFMESEETSFLQECPEFKRLMEKLRQ